MAKPRISKIAALFGRRNRLRHEIARLDRVWETRHKSDDLSRRMPIKVWGPKRGPGQWNRARDMVPGPTWGQRHWRHRRDLARQLAELEHVRHVSRAVREDRANPRPDAVDEPVEVGYDADAETRIIPATDFTRGFWGVGEHQDMEGAGMYCGQGRYRRRGGVRRRFKRRPSRRVSHGRRVQFMTAASELNPAIVAQMSVEEVEAMLTDQLMSEGNPIDEEEVARAAQLEIERAQLQVLRVRQLEAQHAVERRHNQEREEALQEELAREAMRLAERRLSGQKRRFQVPRNGRNNDMAEEEEQRRIHAQIDQLNAEWEAQQADIPTQGEDDSL
nr:MAG: hypothetical protein [Chemarfal virus 38]